MCEKLYDLHNYVVSSDYVKFFLLGYCSYKLIDYYLNDYYFSQNHDDLNISNKINTSENKDTHVINNTREDFESWDQFIIIDDNEQLI